MQGQPLGELEVLCKGRNSDRALFGEVFNRIFGVWCVANPPGDFVDLFRGLCGGASSRIDERNQEVGRGGLHLHAARRRFSSNIVIDVEKSFKGGSHVWRGGEESFGQVGEGPSEPFASAAIKSENSSIGLWNLEKNPANHQPARIIAEVMWLVRSRDEDMPGHEGVCFVSSIEDKIPFEAEAEFHTTGMIMEVGPLSNGEEIAETQDGNAVDAVRAEVKDPIPGFVAIGYPVGYHFCAYYSK